MVFSSLPSLYHLDPPPNWPHQQLDQQPEGGLIHAQNSQVPPPPPLPLPPPVFGDAGGGDKGSTRPGSMADRARLAKIAQPEAEVKCPRCESTNTKFCYYNNYSLSQPRHFCKTCRRYWTRGGALRNVPVGGGCRRKNKRSNNNKGTNNNSRSSSKSPNNSSNKNKAAAAAATTPGSNIIISNSSASAKNNSSSNCCPNNSDHLHHHHLIAHHLPASPLIFPPPTTSHSYSDYDVVFGATTSINDSEFQICGSNNSNNNTNNGFITTTSEQWKLPSLLLQHHQQFPATFLSNLEAPVGLYHHHQFQRSENVEIEPSSSTLLYPAGTVKMEENMDQTMGLSKTRTGNPENDNNEQFWELANNNNNGSAWNSSNNASISFTSSSITHLL